MFDFVKDNLVSIAFGAIGGILGVGILKGAGMIYDKIAGPAAPPAPNAPAPDAQGA